MNPKTIVGIILIPIALVGICCGGLFTVAGISRRLFSSAAAPTSLSANVTQTQAEATPRPLVPAKPQAIKVSVPVATKEPARLGGVEVWVVRVWQWTDQAGNVLVEAGQTSPLQVRLRIVNRSRNRKIDYVSWQNRGRTRLPVLADEHGNRYRNCVVDKYAKKLGHIEEGTTGPGESIDDVLTFESPINTAKNLTLKLDGEALGEIGIMQFSIPRDLITTASPAELFAPP